MKKRVNVDQLGDGNRRDKDGSSHVRGGPCCWASACSRPPKSKVATTRASRTGLLAAILPAYERQARVRVEVLAVGSGQREPLNGEVTVGLHMIQPRKPRRSPGTIKPTRRSCSTTSSSWCRRTTPRASRGRPKGMPRPHRDPRRAVVSRADASGTFSREQELWALAKQRPLQDHLLETGQGMGGTLRVAGEMGAYTLSDRATFEQFQSGLRLASLYEGGSELLNTYAIFVRTDSTRAERVAATALADWFADGEGRDLVASFVANGRIVFNVWPAGTSRSRPGDLPPVELANAR